MASFGKIRIVALRGAASALALSATAALADDAHPFAQYVGSWQGAGRVESVKGEVQPMTCAATCEEAEGGKALSQSIECKGRTFRFQIENYIVDQNGSVVGNWRELTQQVIGNVTGQVQGTLFTGKISAPAFSATVWMKADGHSQALRVLPTGVDVAKVEMVMKR